MPASVESVEVLQIGNVIGVFMWHLRGIQGSTGPAQRLLCLVQPPQLDLDSASVVQHDAVLPTFLAVVLRGVRDGLIGQVNALLRIEPQIPRAIHMRSVHEQGVEVSSKGGLLLREGDSGA
ncbi:hypothetical protein ABL78_4096 [Leptomonas seymouri]|uniref:Uncharacterized protein n=1 Tax=Leptomonas seymouri TaxID=5684 RepID=A0A0N0P5S9_LEPSE|nr:hypothetical protein ABL78_4096 [Leptomonas seymouri]|eukprot:KPI86819.1 hypothetical protein ABL78_4096 [Leptomonas seymouri]